MSKIQTVKRITVEDYDEKDRPVVGKIASSFNIFAQDVQNALDKGLTIQDNLNLSQKTITVIVDASGVPTTTTVIKSGLSGNCAGIQVIKATNISNPSTFPTAMPFISFADNAGLITIQNIRGLQANNKYQLNIILFPQN